MGWLAAAACPGIALACNAVSGLDKLSFTGKTTGTGASSSSGTMSSSSSGTGGADAGPPPATVWAKSFGDMGDASGGKQSVNAIAVAGPGGMVPGHVYLTGRGNALAGLGCTNSGKGSIGYLVELDSTGICKWGYGFGDVDAEGFGVAVDPAGDIVLAGTFTGTATVQGWPMTASGGFRSAFIAVFNSDHVPLWIHQLGATEGDPSIAATAMAGGNVVVGGSFGGGSLDVSSQTSSMVTPPSPLTGNGARTGFALIFQQADGTFVQDFTVDGASSSQSQEIESVALSAAGRYAFAGTGSGDPVFNGTGVTTSNGPNTLLGAYRLTDNHTSIQIILEGGLAQTGQHVALFDGGDALLGGAYSHGTLDVGGMGPSGPTLNTATNGSIVVARYNGGGTGTPVAIQLASDNMSDSATIGGIALHGTGAADGGSVVFAGGFINKAILLNAPPVIADAGSKAAVYVAKVDPTLSTAVWLQSFGDGHAAQAADAVAVDPTDGSVLVAGQFLDTLDFGANAGTVVHAGVSSTTPDVFVVKLVP